MEKERTPRKPRILSSESSVISEKPHKRLQRAPLDGKRDALAGGATANRRNRVNQLNWDEFILGLKKTTKEFIENVLENIIESIVMTNIDGRLVFFNTFSEEMFGYRAEEVLNRHIAVLGATDPDVIGEIRRNRPFHGEITLRTKDGRIFPAHVRCVPLRDEKDRPIAMVGVARDLSKEKEKEFIDHEIARLKAFSENIIASVNDGIQILDLQGTITFANPRLEELLEYPPGGLLGLHFSRVVVTEGRSTFRKIIQWGGTIPGKTSFETRLVSRSGRSLPVLVSSSPVVEDSGVVGIVIAVTDLSEMQRLKEDLFHSEKMCLIGTLAGEVAHEINNPLGGLVMAVQMLKEDVREANIDPHALLDELTEIEADARRCRHIVNKLLEFSRRMPEERTLLNINDLIEDALLLVQRQAELDDVLFTKNYAEDLPLVRVNTNDLQQVIINLVKNARDAMPAGGCIDVTTCRASTEGSDAVSVSVSDTGPGIPAPIAERVFDSFFTTKPRSKGTGLGLAVGKRIVEDHGGRISLTNRVEGGATFRIVLPAATPSLEGDEDA